MNAAPDTDCDIAIVGGGLVGAPLALALAAGGRRVSLLERLAPASSPAAGSARSTLHGAVGRFRGLARAAGAVAGARRRRLPIRRVHVSHRGRFGATRMSAAEHGVDALGHVVENRAVPRRPRCPPRRERRAAA